MCILSLQGPQGVWVANTSSQSRSPLYFTTEVPCFTDKETEAQGFFFPSKLPEVT